MSDLMKVGPDYGGTGTLKPHTATISGAQRVSDAHGRYFEALRAGNAYGLSVSGGAATAYIGAAAGTPLIAVHNPDNSGKLISILAAGVANRVAAGGAGTVGFSLFAGPSAMPTGTQTQPTNMLSLAAGGATGRGFVNTALTGSTALSLVMPLGAYYWASAAGATLAPLFFDVGGLILLAPGNQVALGASAALAAATYDAGLIWEEIPYLP